MALPCSSLREWKGELTAALRASLMRHDDVPQIGIQHRKAEARLNPLKCNNDDSTFYPVNPQTLRFHQVIYCHPAICRLSET